MTNRPEVLGHRDGSVARLAPVRAGSSARISTLLWRGLRCTCGCPPDLDDWSLNKRHSPIRKAPAQPLTPLFVTGLFAHRGLMPRGLQWQATAMLPGVVDELVSRYLRQVDLAVPGAIEGFYVVGSTALGAFRPGRSDVDFVAVVGDRLSVVELSRLRWAQRRLYAADLAHTFLRPPWRWPLTCNGVFVRWADLSSSPLTVVPIASHSAWRGRRGIRREPCHMACAGRARHRRPRPSP